MENNIDFEKFSEIPGITQAGKINTDTEKISVNFVNLSEYMIIENENNEDCFSVSGGSSEIIVGDAITIADPVKENNIITVKISDFTV